MKNYLFAIIAITFLFLFLFFTSCSEDSLTGLETLSEPPTKSINNAPDSLVQNVPDLITIKEINQKIKNDWSTGLSLLLLDEFGWIDFNQAHQVYFNDSTSNYYVSIPVVNNENVNAIIFYYSIDGQYSFELFSAEFLKLSFDEIINEAGISKALFSISAFSNHQFFITQEPNIFQDYLHDFYPYAESLKTQYWCEDCTFIYTLHQGFLSGYIECKVVMCAGTGPTPSSVIDQILYSSLQPYNQGGDGEEIPVGNTANPPGADFTIDNLCDERVKGDLIPYLSERFAADFPCESEDRDGVTQLILNNLCSGDDAFITEEHFFAELTAFDYITIFDEHGNCKDNPEGSMKEDCPKLHNLLKGVVGEDGTKPTCEMLEDLGSSTKIETRYIWDCDNTRISPDDDNNYPLGQVPLSDENILSDQIEVYFNRDICEEDCIKILSVILHESLHAEMLRTVIDNAPNDDWEVAFNGPDDAIATWNQIARREYDNTSNQHVVMAKYYAKQYAKALQKFFGVGDYKDYYKWVFDGLGIPSGDPVLPAQDWADMESNWNSIESQVNAKLDGNCNPI